jgi:uncharacterized protein (TIGR00255 family)
MSLRSMTGFGRARTELAPALAPGAGAGAGGGIAVLVEVRSVNLKGLEVKIRLPRALVPEEPALMRRVKSVVERGRVDVSIELQAERSTAAAVVDEARVDAVIAALQAIARSHPEVSASMTGGELLGLPGVFLRPADDEHAIVVDDTLMAAVNAAVDEATRGLVRARADEGAGLTLELRRRKDSIARLVDDVAARTATAVADKQAKLRERLAVLLGEHLEPGRLVAELALMAERLDVTEELARLRLHLEQLEQLLLTAGSGRRIDFLCQEFLREANTVASKCADATTAHLVVELKAEIERLREQAQNVE